MAVNQLMQAHDEFFDGTGGIITYGGWVPGTMIIYADGHIDLDRPSRPPAPSTPSVEINVLPPSFLPIDFDGDYHNDFLYGEAEDLAAEVNYTGTSGFTIVSYSASTSGLVASLSEPSINTGDAKGDTYGPSVEGLGGTAFNDVLYGSNLGNILLGGAGADQLFGLGGDDRLFGDGGNDTVDGGYGNDVLSGNTGNDVLFGRYGNDWLDGGGGNDHLDAGEDNDVIFGAGGDDTIIGWTGNDILAGGIGADSLDGGDGFDTAVYSSTTSGIRVSLMNPSINTGEAQGDVFVSIEGLQGTTYSDMLQGNGAANELQGLGGNDELLGGAGADTLDGGASYDTLVGGDGSDVLSGSSGRDVFRFDWTLGSSNVDTITDFNVTEGDKIELETHVFRKFPDVVVEETDDGLIVYNSQLQATQFKIGSEATTAAHRIIYNSTTGALFYDADGTGAGVQVQFAQLKAGLALSASSFGLYTL
ncbi:calcium-binding protein [Microvirga flavescens]|uniref:calcium-binding protein n=1 Tax=Microvirga flavescens TaxID=2249811 RepID=UPI000DDAB8DC|nr:calcium-binding protein [Microvirga flavescens]